MKKITLIILSTFFIANIKSQDYKDVIPAVETACELIIDSIRKDDKRIVNNGVLDDYFAKKTAYYITGASDLSYFKNYATISTTDGEMFLGVNFAKESQKDFISYVDSIMKIKTDSLYFTKSDNRKNIINTQKSIQVKNMFTVGLLANTKDDFTKIFSKNSLVSELGVKLKYTRIGNGIIWFDKKSKEGIKKQLDYIKGSVLYDITNDTARHNAIVKQISLDSEKQYFDSIFYNEAKTKYLKSLYEKISAQLDGYKYINQSFTYWGNLEFNLPITTTDYQVISDYNQTLDSISKKDQYLFSTGALLNFLFQNKNFGNFYANFGFYYAYTNSIISQRIDQISLGGYLAAGGSDSLVMANIEDKEIYLGGFENYFTPSIKGKLVYFLPKTGIPILNNFGLSFAFEKKFGDYDPLNLQFGIPMHLVGQKKEKPVNIELQLKFNDFNDNILPNKTQKEKMVIGIALGVPFGNLSK